MNADDRAAVADPTMVGTSREGVLQASPPTAGHAGTAGNTPTLPQRDVDPLDDTTKKRAAVEMGTYTDTDHVTVVTPSIAADIENVTQGASLHGTYLVDVVSAASVDIVSTASRRWREVRHAGTLDAKYTLQNLGVSAGGAVSREPDYLSYGGLGQVSYDLDEKNTTLFFGLGYSQDTIGRSTTPFSVFSRSLSRGTLVGGINQVVDRSTIASLAMNVMIENGDQSKPYRYIPMFAPGVAAAAPLGASIAWVTENRLPERPLEQLPLARRRVAFAGSIGHRFDGSTVRADERVYFDTWGLKASTTDARWFFDLGRRVTLWPHLRFHAQTGVDFWQRAYVSASGTGWNLPELRTGDRELGPLRTVTGGGGAKLHLGPDAHPRIFAIGIHGDAMFTSYLDDLYLTERSAYVGVMTLEVEEP
ncbi:MAG: DUF3570 domain-containing protein [Polyangiaceae bacterium]